MNKSFKTLGTLGTIVFPTLFLNTHSALANMEVNDEVIVTGGLVEESLLEQPSSVSVLDQSAINDRQAIHAEDLLNSIANVNFSTGASRGRFIQIRGIGERSQFVEPRNPSVGLTVDDLDLSSMGLSANLFDVAQMEVFRGPQGTSSGANGMAGLIHLQTNDFDANDFVQTRIGNYNTQELGFASTLLDSADLKARISVQGYKSDGYMSNSYLDRDDTQNISEFIGRIKTEYSLSDNQLIKFNYYRFAIDNGYDAFTLDNSRESLADQPGFDQQFSHAASVNYQLKLDSISIESIFTRSISDLAYGYDEDWVYDGFDVNGYSSKDGYFRDRGQTTAEVRIKQSVFDNVGLTYGIYFKENQNDLTRKYTYLSSDFNSQHEVKTQASYGKVKWLLTEQLQLNAGLRFETRDSTYTDSDQISFTPNESNLGGHISLLYQINDSLMAYTTLSEGFKAGGFNTENTLASFQREYGSEKLQSLELGFKGQVDNTFFTLAAFSSKRIDQQLKRWDTRTNIDGSTEFYGYLINAESGTNNGLELSLEQTITEQLTMFLSAGWLDATYDDYRIADRVEQGQAIYIDYSGRQQAHAPSYQYNLGANYAYNQWNARIEWDGKDSFYFSDSHDEQSNPFNLLHLSAGYQNAEWDARIFVRNVMNTEYQTRGFGGFGNNPKNGYAEEPYYQLGNPRTFGASVSYTF